MVRILLETVALGPGKFAMKVKHYQSVKIAVKEVRTTSIKVCYIVRSESFSK